MTIAAAYLVTEGVVLGGDSSTTVYVTTEQGRGVVQLLTHSQKVFEVGNNSRFGVCTWGAGSLGNTSHRTVFACMDDKMNAEIKVREAAEMLGEMAMSIVKEQEEFGFVGYYLGGWDIENHKSSCYKIEISQKEKKIEPLSLGVCSFSGNATYFSRVFRGYDPMFIESLGKEIKKRVPSIKNFDDIFNEAFNSASKPFLTAGYKDLPIREAIDFVYSYLHITLKAEKFSFGPPSCGGPIEIGFITTDRKYRWIRHKTFSSAITEQEGGYDVNK